MVTYTEQALGPLQLDSGDPTILVSAETITGRELMAPPGGDPATAVISFSRSMTPSVGC